MTKPLRPDQIAEKKLSSIPSEVIEAVNQLLTKHYSNGRAHFRQDELVTLIENKFGISRASLFENKWLDVELVFEGAGWKVEYDSPGYNETYPATFEFRKK